jgi:flagellar basal-body rod protein FlgB
MFAKLDIFQTAGAMARHATLRQNVIAENIANADTPGYQARDVASFAASLGDTDGLRRTRPGHLGAPDTPDRRYAADGTMPSPNGNAVSVETEMVNAVEVRRQHDRALAIYTSSLTLLRASIGRR